MDKTPVLTGTLEEDFIENILSGPMDRRHIEDVVAAFRTKFEEECFQTWDIAQAFKIDQDHNRFLDEKRVFTEQREGFYAAVGAYNRERKKAAEDAHVYAHPDLPEDDMQYAGGDCCSDPEHEHETKPAAERE